MNLNIYHCLILWFFTVFYVCIYIYASGAAISEPSIGHTNWSHGAGPTWRIIPGIVSSDRMGTPIYFRHKVNGHLEGELPQPQELGTKTITMVINHLQVMG